MDYRVCIYPNGHYRRKCHTTNDSTLQILQNIFTNCCSVERGRFINHLISSEASGSTGSTPSDYGGSAYGVTNKENYYRGVDGYSNYDGREACEASDRYISIAENTKMTDSGTHNGKYGSRKNDKHASSVDGNIEQDRIADSANENIGGNESFTDNGCKAAFANDNYGDIINDKNAAAADGNRKQGRMSGGLTDFKDSNHHLQDQKVSDSTNNVSFQLHGVSAGKNGASISDNLRENDAEASQLQIERTMLTGAEDVPEIIYSDNMAEPYESNAVTSKLHGDLLAGVTACVFSDGGITTRPARSVLRFGQCGADANETLSESLNIARLGDENGIRINNINQVFDTEEDIARLRSDRIIGKNACTEPKKSIAISCLGLDRPMVLQFPNEEVKDEFAEELKYKVATRPPGSHKHADSDEKMKKRISRIEETLAKRVNTDDKPTACDRWVTVRIYLSTSSTHKATRVVLDFEAQWLCLRRQSQLRTLPMGNVKKLFHNRSDVDARLPENIANDNDDKMIIEAIGFNKPFIMEFADTTTKNYFAAAFNTMMSKEAKKSPERSTGVDIERMKRSSVAVMSMMDN